MDDSIALPAFTLTRFAHVYTAIVLGGGTVFVRFVLMPAASSVLSEDLHAQLRAGVMAIWKKIVHGGIAILLLSGGFNYFRVIVEGAHKGDKLYHALLGTKILMALAVFFLASALVGRSPKFEGLRKNARWWLTVVVVLTTAIVAISGFLKVRGVTKSRQAVAELQSN